MYRNVSLWIAVFFVNFIFQLYRGSGPDLIFFGLALALVVLESTGFLNRFPEFKSLRKIAVYILPIYGALLIFAKRESESGRYLFYSIFMFMFLALWRQKSGDQISLSKREINLARSISFILIAICTWEILMFTMAQTFSDDWHYPTISVLIVPYLDGLKGRLVFVLLWSVLGIFLIRDWSES